MMREKISMFLSIIIHFALPIIAIKYLCIEVHLTIGFICSFIGLKENVILLSLGLLFAFSIFDASANRK